MFIGNLLTMARPYDGVDDIGLATKLRVGWGSGPRLTHPPTALYQVPISVPVLGGCVELHAMQPSIHPS